MGPGMSYCKETATWSCHLICYEICLNLSAIKITAAIKTLGDKKDSSRQAIIYYILY